MIKSNIREYFTEKALNHVTKNNKNEIKLIEIGCMFREKEGKSTLILTNVIKNHISKGKLYSIELTKNHISACIKILNNYSKEHIKYVEFINDYGINGLRKLINENTNKIDFISLDGGAQPEVCLEEFEVAVKLIKSDGIIIVDDIQGLSPSKSYPYSRPMGKGTFIYPFLLLEEYINNKNDIIALNWNKNEPKPNSKNIKLLPKINILANKNLFFKVVGDRHKILIVGNKSVIEMIEKEKKEYFTRFRSVMDSLKILFKSLFKTVK